MPKACADSLHDEYVAAAEFKRAGMDAVRYSVGSVEFADPTGAERPPTIVLSYPSAPHEGREASLELEGDPPSPLSGCVMCKWRVQNWKCDVSVLLGEPHKTLLLSWLTAGAAPAESADLAGFEPLLEPDAAKRESALSLVTAAAPVPDSQFRELADQWREETAVMSSIRMIAMHPAYQRIIGMGPRVVPLILRELEREPDHWFWALTAMTGEDPVPREDAGNLQRMTDAWLRFGRERGWI